jgi:hypothetical protein
MSDEPNAGSAGGIEICPGPTRGELTLICNSESFQRLRDLVLAAAGCTSAIEDLNALVVIERRVGAPKPSRFRYLVGLTGCGMAGFVVLFVLTAGVWAIVGWMR